MTTVEIPVAEATAKALQDARRRMAIGRLIDLWVLQGSGDPLASVLDATQAAARIAGLTEQDIENELVAYNAERRG